MTLAAELLDWYDANRRDLPWRAERTAYEIWVSEVMLQQTRVETVTGYYEDFLGRFPTHHELAAAAIEEVLAAWSGLGYYRRARQLHAAAGELSSQGREVPESPEELRQLPGIGEYTAAAIASIAFDAPVAVLDGNVERVLSRLVALVENPRLAGPRRKLRELAETELDPTRPGDFNQAMMELGATICLPRAPLCRKCPLRNRCSAFAAGRPEAYPALPARRKPRREYRRLAVVQRAGRTLLARRPDDAELLAGMWELPWVHATRDGATRGVERALEDRYGGTWRIQPPAGKVRHAMTYRAIEVAVCAGGWCEPERGASGGPAGEVAEGGSGVALRFVSRAELAELPTTSLVDKALAVFGPAG